MKNIIKIVIKTIINMIIMSVYIVAFLPLLLIGWLGYGYIDWDSTKEEKYFHKKLGEFKKSGKDNIPLKELTNFEWDEACYIHPYGWTKKDTKGFIFDKEIDSDNEGISHLIFFDDRIKKAFVIIVSRNSSNNIEIKGEEYCSSDFKLLFTKENLFLTN